jgi:hypothetical protein
MGDFHLSRQSDIAQPGKTKSTIQWLFIVGAGFERQPFGFDANPHSAFNANGN